MHNKKGSKMKLLYLVVLLTAYVSAVDQDLSMEGLENIIRVKCERKSGATAFRELSDSIDDAFTCLKKEARKDNKNANDLQQFCEGFSNNPEVYGCVTPIGEKLRACLEDEESYLPSFLYGAFNHTVTEFCGPDGETKFDYIMAMLQYSDNGFKHIDFESMGKTCFPVLAIFKSANYLDGKTFMVKESEICGDMENFQTCVINSIKEQSKKNHSQLVHYIMEPLLSWCAKRTN